MGKSTDIDAGDYGALSMANSMLTVDVVCALPGFLLKCAMEGMTETPADRTGKQAATINKDG
jgi:hypothetical protein